MPVNGIFTTFEDINNFTLTPRKIHLGTRINTDLFQANFVHFSIIKEDNNYNQ